MHVSIEDYGSSMYNDACGERWDDVCNMAESIFKSR